MPEIQRAERPAVVLYASAGAGHRSAARAIGEVLPEAGWTGPVEVLDLLAFTPSWFRWLYSDGYHWIVRSMPYLWEWGYERREDLTRFTSDGRIVRGIRGWIARRMVRHLIDLDPGLVLSTHFTCSDVVSDMVAAGRLDAWCGTVLTDHGVHTIWLQQGMDACFVPDEKCRHAVAAVSDRLGLETSDVVQSGIPIRKEFTVPADVSATRRRLGLREGVPCVIVMGGSRDRWTVVRILEQLGRVATRVDVLVISGKNRRVAPAVQAYSGHPTMLVKDLGIIDYIADVFGVADLLVTKAGGSTVSEAAARGLPMVVFRPYKGQEERNADWLLEGGAAIRLSQFAGMGEVIDALLADRSRLEAMRSACLRLAVPAAAIEVARAAAAGAARRR